MLTSIQVFLNSYQQQQKNNPKYQHFHFRCLRTRKGIRNIILLRLLLRIYFIIKNLIIQIQNACSLVSYELKFLRTQIMLSFNKKFFWMSDFFLQFKTFKNSKYLNLHFYVLQLGYPLGSSPLPLHRHLKYPIPNFSCSSTSPVPFPSNFGVDRFLLPSTAAYSHFQSQHHRADCLVDPTNPKITSIPPPSSSSVTSNPLGQQTKRKRSWSRAVFSQLQRKGLEIQFQIQKYITKPDRRKLAARLGLTDAQVYFVDLYFI